MKGVLPALLVLAVGLLGLGNVHHFGGRGGEGGELGFRRRCLVWSTRCGEWRRGGEGEGLRLYTGELLEARVYWCVCCFVGQNAQPMGHAP